MSLPGDGGQQGRAHSRQLINPLFSGFFHSGRLSTSHPLHHKASFRSPPALVPFSYRPCRTLKRKHNLPAKPVALCHIYAGSSGGLSCDSKGMGHQTHCWGQSGDLFSGCLDSVSVGGSRLGTVCPPCAIYLSVIYKQMGNGTHIFPWDSLAIHFLVITRNHFSAHFSSQAGLERASSSSSYLLSAWDWASTHLLPATGISGAKP